MSNFITICRKIHTTHEKVHLALPLSILLTLKMMKLNKYRNTRGLPEFCVRLRHRVQPSRPIMKSVIVKTGACTAPNLWFIFETDFKKR